MQKNVAGQKWTVFAFGGNNNANPGDPVTGIAANVFAQLSQDGGILAALADTNPVELGDGYYVFDISQAESNANQLTLAPTTTAPDVLVVGCPAAQPTMPANFPDAVINANGLYSAQLAPDVVHGGGTQTRLDINNSGGAGDAVVFHGGTGVGASGFRVDSESTSGIGMLVTGENAGWYAVGRGANARGAWIEGQGTDPALEIEQDGAGVPVDYNGTELLAAIWAHDQAGRLMEGARQLRPFTVGAASTASSIVTDITDAPYTNVDHYAGRVVTINEETQTIIGSSNSPVILTVTDFASVPSQNDLGVIS